MKKKLFCIYINTFCLKTLLNEIINLTAISESSYVCVANVHMLIEAHRSNGFANTINNANLTIPDGMPLVWALNRLYRIKSVRVAGMDLLPALLMEAELCSIPVYLYGSTPEVLSAIQLRSRAEFPRLILAGVESPPFRALSPIEEREVIERINNSGAHLVLVALGCPKQEKWMASMKGRINAVMVGLGGAFPVYAGMQTRAPRWMQHLSLEWLYRLMQEPGRLWKRYLVTNTLFIGLLVRELWRLRILGHPSPLPDATVEIEQPV